MDSKISKQNTHKRKWVVATEDHGSHTAASGRGSSGGRNDRGGRAGWLSAAGFAFLTLNCGMAIYRSGGDTASVFFVAVAYLALLLLFHYLRLLDRLPPRPLGREHRWLKAAVWGLSTLLTAMFSSKVAAVMPLWGAVVVWAMGAATVVAGFVALFPYPTAN